MKLVRPASALLTGALALSLGQLHAPSAMSAVSAVAPTSVAAAGAGPEAAGGALRFSPRRFVAGQALTFSGRLNLTGKRRISLQQNMNRPGSQWFPVEGSGARTRPDGSFRFTHPGPAMMDISFRVVAQRVTTPRVTLHAKSQDLALWVAGSDGADAERPGRAQPGEPFTIAVDTTPDLQRRPETEDLPVFAGRTLTLQKRRADFRWETVGTTEVAAGGMGYFPGVREDAGTVVYRVRQESVTTGANRIGWFPSFPTYIPIGGQARAQRATTVGPAAAAAPEKRAPTGTAGERLRWFPVLYDFTWELGQSLSAPPPKGQSRRGRWEDWSNGTGRVSQMNGGLLLDSGRVRGPGGDDVGTTRATLRGNARAYGRWETRLRARTSESGGGDYRIRVELVPATADAGGCVGSAITVAEVSAAGRTMSFGARSGSRQWRGSTRVDNIQYHAPAVAVEVSKRHITWFLNGRPVGTVKNRAAISSGAKTLRLSLVGDGQEQMDQTLLNSDWQRGFALHGKQTTGGRQLRSSTTGGC